MPRNGGTTALHDPRRCAPLRELGDQRRGQVGLGVAVDYALDIGVEDGWARIQQLAARLRSELAALDGVTVQDRGAVLGATVTFTVDGLSADEVQDRLAAERINVVSMEASSRGSTTTAAGSTRPCARRCTTTTTTPRSTCSSTPSEELEHRERDDRPPSVVSHARDVHDARGRVDRH